MSQQAEPHVDHKRLLAELDRGDPDTIARAYRMVFGSELGRWVLTHQLAEAGVGQWRDRSLPALDRAHLDGEAAHALRILDHAGFGALSAAHLIAANTLEGQDYDRYDASGSAAGSTAGSSGGQGEGFSGPDLQPD